MTLKMEIDWGSIYDNFMLKLSSGYIENRSYVCSPDFTLKKVPAEVFLENVRSNFLRFVRQNIYYAFSTLQMKLPVLAEHIILHCYENKIIEINEFARVFIKIYTYENIEDTLFSEVIRYDKLLEIFLYCRKGYALNKEDKSHLEKLPNEIKIFRGSAGREFDIVKRGISWTIDKEIAIRFAKNYRGHFKTESYLIIQGIVKKKDIVFFTNHSGRYENEVIVDPDKNRNIKILRTGI